MRATWVELPREVHDAVTERFGPLDEAHDAGGGGSDSDVTAWLWFSDGTDLFAKGVRIGDEDKEFHLDVEARVNPWTPTCTPRLRHRFVVAGWDLLVFTAVGTREWSVFEPGDFDLPLVLAAIESLRGCVAPRVALPTLWDHYDHWCEVADRPLLSGLTLVHGDPAHTNFVMTDDQAYLVDWTEASLGPAWADAVLWGARLVSDGGQSPEQAAEWVGKLSAFAEAPRAGVRVLAEAQARRAAYWAGVQGRPESAWSGSRAWADFWA